MSDSSEKVFTPWVVERAGKLPPIRESVVLAQPVVYTTDEMMKLPGMVEELRCRVEGLERENAILKGQGGGRLKPTPPKLPPIKDDRCSRRGRQLTTHRVTGGEAYHSEEDARAACQVIGPKKCSEDTNLYRFKGDQGCFFIDKQKRKGWYAYAVNPVSRGHDFGALGSVDDGGCCGAIRWDRGKASVALKATGLSWRSFRIRCPNDAVQGSFCDQCVKNKNANFFTDRLSVRSKYNGMTHYQFMKENLEY